MSLPPPLSLSLSLSRPILTFRFFFCLKASLLSDIALYSPVLVDEKAKHYLKAKLASSVQYMEDKCDARELASLQTRLQKVLAASHAHSPDVHRLDFGTTLFALAVYELEVRLFVPVSLCVRACACVCVCVSWPSMQQLNSALLSFGLFFFSNSRPCPSPPPKKNNLLLLLLLLLLFVPLLQSLRLCRRGGNFFETFNYIEDKGQHHEPRLSAMKALVDVLFQKHVQYLAALRRCGTMALCVGKLVQVCVGKKVVFVLVRFG